MMPYPKINGVFMRRTEGPDKGKFIGWGWAQPEFAYLAETPWTATEKVDGTNLRVDAYEMRGRTDNAQLHSDLVADLADVSDLVLGAVRDGFLDEGTILYGEGIGPKVQGNRYDMGNRHAFVLFDVWSPARGWAPIEFVFEVAEGLGLDVVPVVGEEALAEWIHYFNFPPFNSHESHLFSGQEWEGVVLRPTLGLLDRRGHRIQTKLKVKDFR
jgi:hypothetical protein